MKKKKEKKENGSHIRYSVVLSLLLLLFLTITLSFSIPALKNNLDKANFTLKRRAYLNEIKVKEDKTYTVYLYSITGIESTKRETKEEKTKYHSALEALLKEISIDELKSGYITYIPKKTKLIGVSYINGVLFASFSLDLERSENLEKASLQIKETLLSNFNEIKKIVLLTENNEFYSSYR